MQQMRKEQGLATEALREVGLYKHLQGLLHRKWGAFLRILEIMFFVRGIDIKI